MTATALSSSLQHKTRATTDHACQIALNQHYHVNSKSGVNFQVALKRNHAKRNRVKTALPVVVETHCYAVVMSQQCGLLLANFMYSRILTF